MGYEPVPYIKETNKRLENNREWLELIREQLETTNLLLEFCNNNLKRNNELLDSILNQITKNATMQIYIHHELMELNRRNERDK